VSSAADRSPRIAAVLKRVSRVAARPRDIWLALAGVLGGVGGALLGISAAFGAGTKGYSVWTSTPAIVAYVLFGLAVVSLVCAAYDIPIRLPGLASAARSGSAGVPLAEEGRPTTAPAVTREPGADRAYRFRVTNIGEAPMSDMLPELIDADGEVCSEPLPFKYLAVLLPGKRTDFVLKVTEPVDRNPLRLRYTWTDFGGFRQHVSNVTVPSS
jgi:hypothetical protein